MTEILHKDLVGDDIHELKVRIASQPPNSVPQFVGQGYYDIVNKKFYVAQGTSLVSDWLTTDIPPSLEFSDTRTISWSYTQVGNVRTYTANVEETELILTTSNLTDFSSSVLSLPEIISLIANEHGFLIMRTGTEESEYPDRGGWLPRLQNGLELDEIAQKIKLSQNLSSTGNPSFDEVTLNVKMQSPVMTITSGGTPTASSLFLDSSQGVVARGAAGSLFSFSLQNEAGESVLSNLVSSKDLIASSLAMGSGNGPGVVHSNDDGQLSASKLVDADVDAAAAISGTKISPDFGSQDITTTGSVLVDVIESNNDILDVLTGSENKVLNIGTGNGYNTVNIGGTNSIVNIYGGVFVTPVENVSTDKAIILNFGASGLSGAGSGLEVQEEHTGEVSLTQAQWQSGNTVRLFTADTSDVLIGDYLKVTGFLNSSNNGTFKVSDVSINSYIDVSNQNRTDGTDDETNPATGAHLVINGYVKVGGGRDSWDFKAPAHDGLISLKQQNNKIMTITSSGLDDVDVNFKTDLTIDQDLQKSASVEFSTLRVSSLSTGVAHSDISGNISSSLIVNDDVSGTAAIAGTKISPDFGSQNVTTTGEGSFKNLSVTGAEGLTTSNFSKNSTYGLQIRGINGSTHQVRLLSDTGTPFIDIKSDGETKVHALSTTGVVKSTSGVLSSALLSNDDVSATAAIAGTKISPDFGSQNITTTGSITGNTAKVSSLSTGVAHFDASGNISSSSIVNNDVSATAAIAGTKISPDFGSQIIQTTSNITGGSLTVNGLSTLNGGQKVKLSSLITPAASPYSALVSDYILQTDTTTGAVTVVLPAAATAGSGAVIIIKDAKGTATTNNITVNPSGSDLIDGDAYIITDPYASITFVSDGVSNWLVL